MAGTFSFRLLISQFEGDNLCSDELCEKWYSVQYEIK